MSVNVNTLNKSAELLNSNYGNLLQEKVDLSEELLKLRTNKDSLLKIIGDISNTIPISNMTNTNFKNQNNKKVMESMTHNYNELKTYNTNSNSIVESCESLGNKFLTLVRKIKNGYTETTNLKQKFLQLQNNLHKNINIKNNESFSFENVENGIEKQNNENETNYSDKINELEKLKIKYSKLLKNSSTALDNMKIICYNANKELKKAIVNKSIQIKKSVINYFNQKTTFLMKPELTDIAVATSTDTAIIAKLDLMKKIILTIKKYVADSKSIISQKIINGNNANQDTLKLLDDIEVSLTNITSKFKVTKNEFKNITEKQADKLQEDINNLVKQLSTLITNFKQTRNTFNSKDYDNLFNNLENLKGTVEYNNKITDILSRLTNDLKVNTSTSNVLETISQQEPNSSQSQPVSLNTSQRNAYGLGNLFNPEIQKDMNQKRYQLKKKKLNENINKYLQTLPASPNQIQKEKARNIIKNMINKSNLTQENKNQMKTDKSAKLKSVQGYK